MKKMRLGRLLWLPVLVFGLAVAGCHSKSNESTTTTTAPDTTTTTTTTVAPAPVTISPDDSLRTGVRDAVKDYPGVTATVENGEINLTGSIERDRLPRLMQSLHSLHPKKVNNNLTVK